MKKSNILLSILLTTACTGGNGPVLVETTGVDYGTGTVSLPDVPEECDIVAAVSVCEPTDEQIEAQGLTPEEIEELPFKRYDACGMVCQVLYDKWLMDDTTGINYCGAIGCSLTCERDYYTEGSDCVAELGCPGLGPHACWYGCSTNASTCFEQASVCDEAEYEVCNTLLKPCNYWCGVPEGDTTGGEGSGSAGGSTGLIESQEVPSESFDSFPPKKLPERKPLSLREQAEMAGYRLAP